MRAERRTGAVCVICSTRWRELRMHEASGTEVPRDGLVRGYSRKDRDGSIAVARNAGR
jgi:hypothetical protein